MEKFEDDLRVGVLPGCGWGNCGDCIKPRINSNTILGMGGGPRGGVIVIWTPVRPNIPTCLVQHFSGINVFPLGLKSHRIYNGSIRVKKLKSIL